MRDGLAAVAVPRPVASRLRAHAIAAAAVAAVTLAGLALAPSLAPSDMPLLYLLAILIGALGGRGPGLTAAALSVAAFDFFFVPPRFTLAVSDLHAWITFAVMFAVGIAIGDLVARLRTQEAATHAVEMRAQAEVLRNALLSSVSHDLRTPLAAITGMATSLRDAGVVPEGHRDELDTIIEEAQRLSRILTNLLAVTKVESGAEPRREWVPLEEIVGVALARLEPELGTREVTIDVAPDVLAHVDPILVEQLLVNLLDNAVKHTAAETPLAIHAHREARRAVLEVADRGGGLPPGPSDRLFDRFERGPTRAAGMGLGLAVCRGVAVAHGGGIEALPREGGGAVLRAWFPDDGAPPRLSDEVAA